MEKPTRTESTPGPKPKPERKRVSHWLSAGVSAEDWPQVLRFVKQAKRTKSEIIRAAFGL